MGSSRSVLGDLLSGGAPPASTRVGGTRSVDEETRERLETSNAERAREENWDFYDREEFDTRDVDYSQGEASLLAGLAERYNVNPSVFERSEEMATYGFVPARTEGEGVEGPDPTSGSGLTSAPSAGTDIILYEGRDPEGGRILGEELIHQAQNELGAEGVQSVINEVASREDVDESELEALRENAAISTDEDYSEQPQEVFAEELLPELPAVQGETDPESPARAAVLEEMMRRMGQDNSRLAALSSRQSLLGQFQGGTSGNGSAENN